MPTECVYRAIVESDSLDRKGMMDVVRYFFPDMPDLINCYRCERTQCHDSMHHDNPNGVLVELEKVRQGLSDDPDYRFLEPPHMPGHNGHLSFPVVLQNSRPTGNGDVRPQRPHRVYIDLNQLSGDPKTDSQIFREHQENQRVHAPVEEDLESVLV